MGGRKDGFSFLLDFCGVAVKALLQFAFTLAETITFTLAIAFALFTVTMQNNVPNGRAAAFLYF